MLSFGALFSVGSGGCSRPPRESSSTQSIAPPVPVASAPLASASAQPASVSALASSTAAAAPAPPSCGETGVATVFVSPAHPVKGQPLRIVAVTDRAVDATLTLDIGSAVTTAERHGGPPYFWIAQVDAPAAGKFTATFARAASCGAETLATKVVTVHAYGVPVTPSPRTSLWWLHGAWSPAFENLYSAWVEALFEAPLTAQETYTALHEVLRDRSRNFLFDHMGAGEDEENVSIRPDCADLPYFLRAYFAFKLGLPFGWSRCTRGESNGPPTCIDFATSSDPFPPPTDDDARDKTRDKPPAMPPTSSTTAPLPLPPWADPQRPPGGPWEDGMKRLGEFFRTTLADAAQSGAGRTLATDEDSDYYPIALSAETLRPGTIFGDPYGHVLVVAQRIPQTAQAGGVLLAVDGQPDGTVARKRFWRGNFLFAIDPSLGSPGFKRFRPIVRDARTGKFVRATNAELADFSATDQYDAGVEGFYDKMDDVLSPLPLDPTTALLETIDALEEQVKTRVVSVENGRKFLASGKSPADMPEGAKIFEATGDWEDFSTPSRDLRILIALDVAQGIPARVARRPERYAMPAGTSPDRIKADLEARLADELKGRSFEYTRTDGSAWKLTLRDVLDRQASLEMAYDPNDCVEQRWGAPAGSAELSTCSAHAPAAQVAKMAEYREWFHARRRPAR